MKKQSLCIAIALLSTLALSLQSLGALEVDEPIEEVVSTSVVDDRNDAEEILVIDNEDNLEGMESEDKIEETIEEEIDVESNDKEESNTVYENANEINAYGDDVSIPQTRGLVGSKIENIQVGELGNATVNPGNSVVNIYLFAGESLDIEVVKDQSLGSNSTRGMLKVIDMDGNVVVKGEFDGNNIDPIRLSVPSDMTKTGLYALVYEGGVSTRGTGSNITFQIKSSDGSVQLGRVFAKQWKFEQSSRLIDADTDRRFAETIDLNLYHRSSDGYLYQQEITDFNGILSTLTSDPIGIVNKDTCKQLSFDTRAYNALYPALIYDEEIQNKCNLEVESNNIYLDMPDSKLPAKALNPFGDWIIVNPRLEDLNQNFSEISYHKKSKYEQGGTFSLTADNIQNFVDITINVSENGTGSDTKQIRKKVWVNTKNPKIEFEWDGKYDNGVKVPNHAKISVEVELKKAGEIHFVMEDVETRGGMSVTRVEGYTNNDTSRLFYNSDSEYYPIDWNVAPGFYGSDVAGSSYYDSKINPSFRGWSYIQPIVSQNGQATIQGTWSPLVKDSAMIEYASQGTSGYYYGNQDYSMGDGAYINDWAFEDVSIKQETEFAVEKSQLHLELIGIDASYLGLVKKGDDVNYTITVSNLGTGFAENVVIKDTLKDIHSFIEDPSKNVVLMKRDGEAINYTVNDLINGITIPILDAGETIELSFSVKVKAKLPTSANRKDFKNEVSMKATCDVNDVVNSCSEVIAKSNLLIKDPSNPGIIIDKGNSVNGSSNVTGSNGQLIDVNGNGNMNTSGYRNGTYFGSGWYLNSKGVLTSVYISNHFVVGALSLAVLSAIVIGKGSRKNR